MSGLSLCHFYWDGVSVYELYLLHKGQDEGIEGEVREGLLDGNGHCTTGRISVGNWPNLSDSSVEVFCDLREEIVVWEQENRLGMGGTG